jgi:hypothetical protein
LAERWQTLVFGKNKAKSPTSGLEGPRLKRPHPTKSKIQEEHKMKNEQLKAYVDGIRDDLKNLYELEISDDEREEREENGEPYDLYSYFNDVLDIEYTISSRGDFLGARIYVTLGGPTVWIDTREGYVKGAWGADREESWIPCEIVDEINEIFS